MSEKIIGAEISASSLEQIAAYQVMLVMGGGKGDEGKGGDAYMLAEKLNYDLIIGPIGGPNAGHTVVDDHGNTFVGHNLPGASVAAREVFLGQGKYLNIQGLNEEIDALGNIGKTPKFLIADQAHCIFSSLHGKMDQMIENFKKGTGTEVGTTGVGMGPVVATRAFRTGITFEEIVNIDRSNVEKYAEALVYPFQLDTLNISQEELREEILMHQKLLQGLIDTGRVSIVSKDYAANQFTQGKKILIEGAQSPSLGMYGGAYPNNTATDTSFLGIMSSLNICPVPGRVGQLLVVKVFPSAVGNHVFPERVSHVYPHLLEKEQQFGKATGEYGATSGRPRMVAFPSPSIVAEYIKHNPYTAAVSLRKLDLLENFQEIIGLSQLTLIASEDGKIQESSYDAREVVDIYRSMIDTATGSTLGSTMPFILGFGPEPKNSRIDIA